MTRIYTLQKFKEMLKSEGQYEEAEKVNMMSKEYSQLNQ